MRTPIPFLGVLCWFLLGSPAYPTFAFNDDSTDHSLQPNTIRAYCDNGKTITDSDHVRFSCNGDEVYIDQIMHYLHKNGKQLSKQPVSDFKVSRNGKVYYRTQINNYIYDENGRLDSGADGVMLYLVASTGDVVYLNSGGQLFKNGNRLTHGPFSVPVKEDNTLFQRIVRNPTVSKNGQAVYTNSNGDLFADSNQMNSPASKTQSFKLNSSGDVYFLDGDNRLFRNTTELYDGHFAIIDFQLNANGEVAYLTNSSVKNLFMEGRALNSGANRVVSFSFNSNGEIIYQDSSGRLWKEGTLISD